MSKRETNQPSPTGPGQLAWAGLLLVLLLFAGQALAEELAGAAVALEDAAVTVEPIEPLPADELPELVGRIALYPDDLLSIVLAASTYPLQVVQAARFLEARDVDPDAQPDEDWDESVVALLNYPEALALLNEDLDWTWKLGQAVLVQQEELLAAVAEFRERARVAGNLESDERQTIAVADDGAIEIKPNDPEVIYVPYYEPARVTVYHDYPVYHYYPRAYPVYYYPYPAGYRFSASYFWGVTSAFSIGWSSHRLHLHHHDYHGHPYYGRTYYDRFYYRRPHLRHRDYAYYHRYRHSPYRYHAGTYWRPRAHYRGASPRYRQRLRGDDHRHGSFFRHARHDRHDRHDHHDRHDRHDRHERRERRTDAVVRGPRSVARDTRNRVVAPQRAERRPQLVDMKRDVHRGVSTASGLRAGASSAPSRNAQSTSRRTVPQRGDMAQLRNHGQRGEARLTIARNERSPAQSARASGARAPVNRRTPATAYSRAPARAPARANSNTYRNAQAKAYARATGKAYSGAGRSQRPQVAKSFNPRPANSQARAGGYAKPKSVSKGARIRQSSGNRAGQRVGFAR